MTAPTDPLTDLDFAPCFKCVTDSGPHAWHDDGTPGLGAEDWETGGRYAAPGHVETQARQTPYRRLLRLTPESGT
jgi:hypothetical protein